MKRFIFATLFLFSCVPSETEKRNAYRSELIQRRTEATKKANQIRAVIVGIEDSISQATIKGLPVGNITEATGVYRDSLIWLDIELEDINGQIDSLKLLK